MPHGPRPSLHSLGRVALLGVPLTSGCFTGDFLRGLPCESDSECGSLKCVDGICGGADEQGTTTTDTTASDGQSSGSGSGSGGATTGTTNTTDTGTGQTGATTSSTGADTTTGTSSDSTESESGTSTSGATGTTSGTTTTTDTTTATGSTTTTPGTATTTDTTTTTGSTTTTTDTTTTTSSAGGGFIVQRGSLDFGASENSDTASITPVASLDVAFARITGIRFASGGPVAGTTEERYADDMGVNCLLTATDEVTFTRRPSGQNEDVRVYWEVIEGPSSGPNAIVVRYHDDVTMVDTIGQVDQQVDGISNLDDCVPFISGITTSANGLSWDRATSTAKMVVDGGNNVRLERAEPNDETTVSVAVVEFTGSNWSVDNNIEERLTDDGVNVAVYVDDVVDPLHAFVATSFRNTTSDSYNCWFKDRNELYFRLRSGTTTFQQEHWVVAHVVRNDSMTVEHLDSILGGGMDHPAGSASPHSVTTSITAVGDMSETSVIATADDSLSGDFYYGRHFWQYRLEDTDSVRWWRSQHASTGDWTLQIVQWPGTP